MSLFTNYVQKSGVSANEVDDIVPVATSRAVLEYRVPVLTPDGTCSAGDDLASDPYDLRPILGVTPAQEKRALAGLEQLHGLIEGAQQTLHADWIGVYQKAVNAEGIPVLVKLAYQGSPSRAEFPLTEAFAELSNNSTVGLSGKGVVIRSVAEHQGAYYVCDGNVNSEACLPIYNQDFTEVVGIVDAEAFTDGHFDGDNLATVVKLSQQLSDYLPLTLS
jgi:putative methionine-R-sulfoxide reductase with GAF domain